MLDSARGKRPLLMTAGLALVLTALIATPAFAVTDGELDGNDHDFVGLMVAKDADGNPLWRCSGTLLSSTVFLTAGHCTESPAASAEIWFDADVTDTAAQNYPNEGDVSGTTYTHPDYDPNVFYVRDLGLVILDEPYVPVSGQYGTLPGLNEYDAWKTKRGQQKVRFDSVGYGLQQSFPDAAAWKENNVRVRYIAHPKLNQINTGLVGDYSLLLSNNAHTGGTCFGDSGGPNFVRNTNEVAGVTSFGMNSTCAGTGGVFRMDRSWSLAFVADAADGIMGDDYDGGNN
jgi:secreted trypsin-like serine protease